MFAVRLFSLVGGQNQVNAVLYPRNRNDCVEIGRDEEDGVIQGRVHLFVLVVRFDPCRC